jgi:hypothetical protein
MLGVRPALIGAKSCDESRVNHRSVTRDVCHRCHVVTPFERLLKVVSSQGRCRSLDNDDDDNGDTKTTSGEDNNNTSDEQDDKRCCNEQDDEATTSDVDNDRRARRRGYGE